MAYLWMVTIGFLICLGIIFGAFFFVLRSVLDPEDSTRVDLQNTPTNPNNSK